MEYYPGVGEGAGSMLRPGLYWTSQPREQLLPQLRHASHVLTARVQG